MLRDDPAAEPFPVVIQNPCRGRGNDHDHALTKRFLGHPVSKGKTIAAPTISAAQVIGLTDWMRQALPYSAPCPLDPATTPKTAIWFRAEFQCRE